MERLQYPHPLLREVMPEVEDFGDKDFISAAKTLLQESKDWEGSLGLAANQIGFRYRMCVIKIGAQNTTPLLLVNPTLTVMPRTKIETDIEGCGSLPDRYVVPRYRSVMAKYYDLRGKQWIDRWDGLTARIAQHEVDHLNGKLICDIGTKISFNVPAVTSLT